MYVCRNQCIGNEGILERDFLAGCPSWVEMPGAFIARDRDIRRVHETGSIDDPSFCEYVGRALDCTGVDFIDIPVQCYGTGRVRGNNGIFGIFCRVYELDSRVDRVHSGLRVHVAFDDLYRVGESEEGKLKTKNLE